MNFFLNDGCFEDNAGLNALSVDHITTLQALDLAVALLLDEDFTRRSAPKKLSDKAYTNQRAIKEIAFVIEAARAAGIAVLDNVDWSNGVSESVRIF